MSGLLGGGSTTYEERLASLVVQQSAQGVGITMLWGRQRVAPNLLWFDDFVAIENRQAQGGKGAPGVESVSYTYQASVLMGICAGTIAGVNRVWRDKDVFTSGVRVSPPQQVLFEGVVGPDRMLVIPDAPRWESTLSVVSSLGTVPPYDDLGSGAYLFDLDSIGATMLITYMVGSETTVFSALEAAGFSTFAAGARGQSPWGYLTTAHPSEALGYSGVAYVGGVSLGLSNSAGLKQYSFEVDGRRQVSADVPDANAADVCTDLLLDPLYGAVPDAGWVDGLSQYRDWCGAMGLYLSPSYADRKGAFEYVQQIAELTFSKPLWRVNTFTIVPLATEAVTGAGGEFTPLPEHSAPVYVITDDDIADPIEETRAAPADRFNRVSVQFKDRANDYATAVADAEDKASIDAYGLIPNPSVFDAPEVAELAVAAIVAELRLRQGLSVQGSYKFTLPVNFDLLDPLDIVAIADARIDLGARAVRIVEIVESGDDGSLSITAEDVEITGSVTLASQPGSGFGYQPPEIDATALRAVLMPTSATGDRQQVWVGATAGVNWGGASLWISETGTDYRRIGQFTLRTRMGLLAAALPESAESVDEVHALTVNISGAGGELGSVTQADVDANRTLMWVGGELVAYRDAELVAANRYRLTYLPRGMFGSANASHAVGSAWMRLDEAVLKVDVPPEMIGKSVYLKATGRSLLNTREQGLDEVSAVILDVVAVQSLPAAPSALALTSPFVSTYFEMNWAVGARAFDYEVEVRNAGSLLRAVQTSAQVFRYLHADALDDGGALRSYEVRVRGLNAAGAGPWITSAISNPAPAAVSGIAASGTGSSRSLTWVASAETDVAGYRAWVSSTSGFDPKAGGGTEFYAGSEPKAVLTGLVPGTTRYVRVAAFDVWSDALSGLEISDEFVLVV